MSSQFGFKASDLDLSFLKFALGFTKFTPKVLHLSLKASFVLALLWCCLADGFR
jgi:hypothetical protein